MIYWLIGQPGSGKTTLARKLKQHFDAEMRPAIHLDGDDLRIIFGNLYSKDHFTKEWRIDQTRTLQKFVAHLADQGVDVIVSTVNPYRDVREEFKNSRKDVVEIQVMTDDIRGRENKFAKDWEPPYSNHIAIMTGGRFSETDSFKILLSYL